MEVLLVKDVDRLGKAGSLVQVKDGFARNFLVPRGWAVAATPGNRSKIESMLAVQAKAALNNRLKAQALKSRLEAVSCVIPMKVGDQGKLHGAVTASDLCEALAQQKIPVEKHQVQLKEPLTHLGVHEVSVRLHPEVTAVLKVQIVHADR